MKRAVVWMAVLFVAAATVLIGASAHAQPGPGCLIGTQCGADATTTTLGGPPPSVSTSVPTPSSSDPGTGQRSPYSASFQPCTSDGTQDGSEPCDQTPTMIQVSYPTEPPSQVQVNWVTSGRSAGAPNPDTTSVTLSGTEGSACGTDLMCWPWPAGLDDGAFILNGTYQLAVCPAHSASNGTCDFPVTSQSVGLAVPPGPPTAVSARSAGSVVTISWSPPAQAPPDLVGYTVSRGGAAIYTCSTDDLGPGAGVPCPSKLQVADRPGNGEFTYSVTAQRLGVDSGSGEVVSSAPAAASQGVVTVPGQTPGAPGSAPTTAAQGGTQVPLDTGNSNPVSVPTPSSGGGTQVTLGQVAAAQPPVVSQPVPKLSYPTAPPVAPAKPQALALKVDPPASHQDVVPVAVLALGILSLAVAAHFLYLRVELGVVQARLAARRATGL